MSRRVTKEEFEQLPIGSCITQVIYPHADEETGRVWPMQPQYRHFAMSSTVRPYSGRSEILHRMKVKEFNYFVVFEEGRHYCDKCHEGIMYVADLYGGNHPAIEVYVEGIE